jgi:hypothetical protein
MDREESYLEVINCLLGVEGFFKLTRNTNGFLLEGSME